MIIKKHIIRRFLTILFLITLCINLFACRDDSVISEYIETTEAVDINSLTGSIILYTSVEESTIMNVKSEFEKAYPNIKLEYVYNDNDTLVSQIEGEIKYEMWNCDVLWLDNPLTMENFKNKNYLAKVDLDKYEDILSQYKDSDNFYIAPNFVGIGIAYNLALITEKDVPKSYNDLLKDTASGLVMTDPNTAYISKYFVSALMQNKKYGEDYFNKLKNNNAKLVEGSLEPCNVVDDGEKSMALAFDIIANRYLDGNENFKFRYFDKENIVWEYPIAITSASKNKNLAYVFLDYILSVEGQKVLLENGLTVTNEQVENYVDTKKLKNKCMKIDNKSINNNFDDYLNEFNNIFK